MSTEPPQAGLTLTHEHGRSLWVRHRGRSLLRYVYQPWDAQLESPRPYFHPIHTLGGDEVSLYRPHDHVWHKGIAWSLPNVGPANFWGGTTYRRPRRRPGRRAGGVRRLHRGRRAGPAGLRDVRAPVAMGFRPGPPPVAAARRGGHAGVARVGRRASARLSRDFTVNTWSGP